MEAQVLQGGPERSTRLLRGGGADRPPNVFSPAFWLLPREECSTGLCAGQRSGRVGGGGAGPTLPSSGSAPGPMGPKWSPGTVTRILPLQALARPALTALSVVYASSGLSWLAILATCGTAAASPGARTHQHPAKLACERCATIVLRKGLQDFFQTLIPVQEHSHLTSALPWQSAELLK